MRLPHFTSHIILSLSLSRPPLASGLALSIYGTISGFSYTHYCYHVCPVGQYNPTYGGSSSSCQTCPSDKTSTEGSTSCLVNLWHVTTMTELYNKVSENGDAKTSNGDSTVLATNTDYKCSDGTCYSTSSFPTMLRIQWNIR